MILAIGDSHVSGFHHDNVRKALSYPAYPVVVTTDDVSSCWIGPVTAWNFRKHLDKINEIRKLAASSMDDILVLVAGEIDCRCHVVKQSKIQGKTIDEIAKQCANRMLETCKSVGAIPFWAIPSIVDEKKMTPSPYMAVGTKEERLAASCSYNKEMEKLCRESGMKFVSLYDEVVKDGKPDAALFWDGVHLVPEWAAPRLKEKCLRGQTG